MGYPQLIFGGANFGHAFDTPESVQAILTTLKANSQYDIDTAAGYASINPTASEKLLGEVDAVAQGFNISTKILVDRASDGSGEMAPVRAGQSLNDSLTRLADTKVDVCYIHRPDPSTPLLEQARVLDDLYRQGKFVRLGLCNYTPQSLEAFISVCEDHGFVKPSVYQDNYNVIERGMESHLLPIVRKHHMDYYAYRPLAAGFLAGNFVGGTGKEGTRFAEAHPHHAGAGRLFGSDKHAQAYKVFTRALEETGIAAMEAVLRWIFYHSALKEGDGVIIGASKVSQLEANIKAYHSGPLPTELAKEMNGLWSIISPA